MSWLGVFLGQLTPTVEVAQQVAFTSIFPITFVSNAFVPLQSLPGWLQPFAEWNPVSTLTASMRDLFGNPNPAIGIRVPVPAPGADDRALVGGVRGGVRPARGPALSGHLEVAGGPSSGPTLSRVKNLSRDEARERAALLRSSRTRFGST